MTKYLVVLLGVLLVIPTFGADVFLKAGMNNSYFQSVDNKTMLGPVIGVGADLPIIKSNRFFLGMDLFYIRKQFVLNDVTWAREDVTRRGQYELFNANIDIDTWSIQMPIKTGIRIPIRKNLLKLSIGVSAALAVQDNSKINLKNTLIIEEDELIKNPPDYWYIPLGDDSKVTTVAAVCELQYIRTKWGIAIQINRDLDETLTKFSNSITLSHPLHSIMLLTSYYF